MEQIIQSSQTNGNNILFFDQQMFWEEGTKFSDAEQIINSTKL
jgi:hypothetical protein